MVESNVVSLERDGDILVIVATGGVESLRWELIEQAAGNVLSPLREQDAPKVIFDLSNVNYFGSVFMALLVRCHKMVRLQGGVMVLSGVHPLARDLLHTTALDTLWAIYDTRQLAIESFAS